MTGLGRRGLVGKWAESPVACSDKVRWRRHRILAPKLVVRRQSQIRVIDTPRTFADVAAFIGEFEGRRLPTARWTHEGHLVAGLWYVWHVGVAEALERLRVRIRDHNTFVGTPNTDSSGYHETITRLYVEAIGRLCSSSPGSTFEEVLAKLLSSPMARSDWPLSHYPAEQLFSVRARREWVPPEVSAGG